MIGGLIVAFGVVAILFILVGYRFKEAFAEIAAARDVYAGVVSRMANLESRVRFVESKIAHMDPLIARVDPLDMHIKDLRNHIDAQTTIQVGAPYDILTDTTSQPLRLKDAMKLVGLLDNIHFVAGHFEKKQTPLPAPETRNRR